MIQKSPKSKRKIILLNTLFCLVSLGILIFIMNAPEKSTKSLPHNEDHQRFYSMNKKEAEKYCLDCHGDNGVHPLAPEHPSKLRCLMCHTKD